MICEAKNITAEVVLFLSYFAVKICHCHCHCSPECYPWWRGKCSSSPCFCQTWVGMEQCWFLDKKKQLRNVLSVKNFFFCWIVYQGVLRDQSCACPCWSPPQRGLEYSSYLTWISCFESLNIFVYLAKSTPIDEELQPECNDEVDELPANPGPVSQRGVVVHPLPRDRYEGGVDILVANLHFKCTNFFLNDEIYFHYVCIS